MRGALEGVFQEQEKKAMSTPMESKAVDMVEQARMAQTVDSRLEPGEIRLIAPAKVNLFLDIGDKRPDNYHEASTVMHALMLHDVLRMKLDPSSEGGLVLDVRCIPCEGIEPLDVPTEKNIAARAVRLLAKTIGRAADESMRIIIEKHIPAEAGLGGGSSDAAAALVGAANLWGLAADDPRIEDVARELGADVAFFLRGGCAYLTGVGDVFHHALTSRSDAVVLIKPDGGVSTKAAYAAFDECPQRIDDADRDRALNAVHASEVPLRNNLVCASELLLPALVDVRKWVYAQKGDIVDALMSGSGSAVFVICRDFASACRIASSAQAQGWWSRTTTFGPARAAIVPRR